MNVIAAMRKDGVAGYFKTEEEVPSEFQYPFPFEIRSLYEGISVERQLELMNQHWKEPALGVKAPEVRSS